VEQVLKKAFEPGAIICNIRNVAIIIFIIIIIIIIIIVNAMVVIKVF